MKTFFRSKILAKPEDVADMLARDFIRYTEEMLCFRENIYLAVSGGSTPNLFFDILSTEYPQAINWNRLHVFWVDERCVPHNHIESNFGIAYERCFSKVGIPQQNLHPIQGGEIPATEVIRYTGEILAHVPCQSGYPMFDLILLGMGEDGHTASVFPGQEHLFDVNSIVAVSVNPISGQNRITLTGKIINNAADIVFLVTGHRKNPVIEQIFNKDEEAKLYPASRIIPTHGKVHWYLDSKAAGNG